jgi:hypothetical protein
MNLRYVQHTLICLIKAKYSDSPVWTDLPKIRHIYFQDRSFIVNNGGRGGDGLLGRPLNCEMPLCRMYPIIYDLCLDQNSSVQDVATSGWVIRFKIRLHLCLEICGMS